ncbi:MAG: hydrogen gas-evolving membrane-bound hydrogenase subunit E [bacterium]|nr:hydrogen gas-evolving membrane-bound hydrogenase subunit E [bacterium]
MLAAVLSCYLLALLQPIFHPFDRRRVGWLIGLLPMILTLQFWGLSEEVGLNPLVESYAWVPFLGLEASFLLDGLSATLALMVLGIGAGVMVYSGGYLEDHPDLDRFFSYMLVFMGSMLGLVLAGNLLLIYVFWELTSFSSFLLIGFHHERPGARGAAQRALVVTVTGGLMLLAGLILIGQAAGTYELVEILAHPEVIANSPYFEAILVLVALGCFTKSAQVPFHFWLPGAMAAPTPVSAYLHSATMVNAGIYLLARLHPLLGGSDLWFYLLGVTGLASMLIGAVTALMQEDLKLVLAYSSISVLGVLVMLLGIGTEMALKAMLVLLVGHGLYKSALFLVAGIVDHVMGTREVRRLQGLSKIMPITALAAGLAAFSNAGIPPMFGFVGKELLYEAGLAHSGWYYVILPVSMLSSMFLFATAWLVGVHPFWSQGPKHPKTLGEPPLSMWLGPTVFALAGLFFGIFPGHLTQRLLEPAVQAVFAQPVQVELELWHGLTPTLFFSILTVVGGFLFFLGRDRLQLRSFALRPLAQLSPLRLYHSSLEGLQRMATIETRFLQNGYLRFYLIVIFGSVALLQLVGWAYSGWVFPLEWEAPDLAELAALALIFGGTLAALKVRSFLRGIFSVGVVGLGVVLFFALHSAPDLAMTQVLVETLSLVLVVLMLTKLPHYLKRSSRWVYLRDGAVSILFGASISLGLLLSPAFEGARVSLWHKALALSAGHGGNIVNVILVDFRALDTLGEISVLAAAGIGVYSLFNLKRGRTP